MKSLSKIEVLQRITEIGVIPIVRVDSAELAFRAVSAVRMGGIPIVEITMTVPAAVRIIEELKKEMGDDALIGAGTVLDPKTAEACIKAGAQFIISPSLNPQTITYCNDVGIAVMPGTMTPTEIVTAWSLGADLVKVFPAGEVGGPGFIKALKGPLPHIKMIPTGGVTLATAKAFLEAGSEAIGVSGDLVNVAALRRGEDAHITERARQFVEIVAQVRSAQKTAAASAVPVSRSGSCAVATSE
jgi:2-dehydro-3-deoxyphosphogluconate aldolase/(4S)-4-hydroxy-2-oxoglutarate aldolase